MNAIYNASPERRLMLIVFLDGLANEPGWRDTDPAAFYKIAGFAGIPSQIAATLTPECAQNALDEYEFFVNRGEL